MTLFTIESLTQKDAPCADHSMSIQNPVKQQQQTFLDAVNLLLSGQDISNPKVGNELERNETEAFSDNGSRPISSSSNETIASIFEQEVKLTNSTDSSVPPKTPELGGSSPDSDKEKPSHSYIALIAMAILDSPSKKLLLCDIYQYIMDKFPYFQNNERSWRNSVRHNLSLNECFIKAGRSDDGRGHFWAIHPANIEDFSRGDFRRRRARRRVKALSEYGYLGFNSIQPYHVPSLGVPSEPSSSPHGYIPMTYVPIATLFPNGHIPPYFQYRRSPYYCSTPTMPLPSMSTQLPCIPSSPAPTLAIPSYHPSYFSSTDLSTSIPTTSSPSSVYLVGVTGSASPPAVSLYPPTTSSSI